MKINTKLLKELRKRKGYTQKQLAEKLGVSYVSYQYYEMGTRNPKQKTVNRMELLLDGCISTPEAYTELLIKDIVNSMREAKKVLNLTDIEELKVCEVISLLKELTV